MCAFTLVSVIKSKKELKIINENKVKPKPIQNYEKKNKYLEILKHLTPDEYFEEKYKLMEKESIEKYNKIFY